jgi:hypothetical protein
VVKEGKIGGSCEVAKGAKLRNGEVENMRNGEIALSHKSIIGLRGLHGFLFAASDKYPFLPKNKTTKNPVGMIPL